MTDAPKIVPIEFAPKSHDYDIIIGENLLKDAGTIIRGKLGERRVFIITDANVAQHYVAPLQESLKRAGHITCEPVVVPPGELSKTGKRYFEVMDQLFERKIDRKSLIIALGGGVVGDLAGFVASTILRSVDLVQIPTSLLAQVDSSVGGKTAIDTAYGKNTIGAFYQPRLVLTDVTTLNTLPDRELLAGYGELVKYGLIMDEDFFAWCEEKGEAVLRRDPEALIMAVQKSCEMKAKIVSEDETEKGNRALLNLGHTFAHPLESLSDYDGSILHGEAVALGCVMAFDLSVMLGFCEEKDARRVRVHHEKLGLPTFPPEGSYDIDALMQLMTQDKKAENGALTLILARGIGKSFISKDVSPAPVRAIWQKNILAHDM